MRKRMTMRKVDNFFAEKDLKKFGRKTHNPIFALQLKKRGSLAQLV
jgi:hypothetical protein